MTDAVEDAPLQVAIRTRGLIAQERNRNEKVAWQVGSFGVRRLVPLIAEVSSLFVNEGNLYSLCSGRFGTEDTSPQWRK